MHARGDGAEWYETAVHEPRVVVDWDGTVTEIDGLHLVLLEFGDRDVYEEHESRLGRDLTLREVIAGEFLTVRAPLDEVVRWMRANAASMHSASASACVFVVGRSTATTIASTAARTSG